MKTDHERATRDALTLGMMERYSTVSASPHMPCEYNLARAYLALREELTAKARDVVERILAAPADHAAQLKAIDDGRVSAVR